MNNIIPLDESLENAAIKMRLQALTSVWSGKAMDHYFLSCRWYVQLYEARIILMRESGYHSGGWWKNPEYERCWHLSISYDDSGRNEVISNKIIKEIFGENIKWLWCEGPYTKEGKRSNVWHYRLFCDEHWTPIKPKGEVYSTHFTEKGWKSFSELNNEYSR
jgi:hypothetical protein